jgi:restriction system protein
MTALRDLGGSAKPGEVVDLVVEMLGISDDERAERVKSGSLRIDNQVHWARQYLVMAGLLDGSLRGRWQLSSQGWALPLGEQNHDTAYALFKRVRSDHKGDEVAATSEDDDNTDSEQAPAPVTADESSEVALIDDVRLAVLECSPAGFELLCKRLLTEMGLVQLRTVGQAGDRGIDVEGHLRLNSIVSFRVGVQCKRYAEKNQVTPNQIRELQGALGPFDRGIFITTSVFTQQAAQQANAPGYKPIDLIDGERLVELLIEKCLGVRQTVVVDPDFFTPFHTTKS